MGTRVRDLGYGSVGREAETEVEVAQSGYMMVVLCYAAICVLRDVLVYRSDQFTGTSWISILDS